MSFCINLKLSDEDHILNTLFVSVFLFYLAQSKKIRRAGIFVCLEFCVLFVCLFLVFVLVWFFACLYKEMGKRLSYSRMYIYTEFNQVL